MFAARVTGVPSATYLIWLCTPPAGVQFTLASVAPAAVSRINWCVWLFPVTYTRPKARTSTAEAPVLNFIPR